jgi:putative flippase GtrA
MSIAPSVADEVVGDDSQPGSDKQKLVEHPELRRFIKFCIVGSSSAAVNFGMVYVFHYLLHLPLFTSLTLAFLMSVANGFFWNRKWTWKAARGNSTNEQSIKFLLVSTIGYFLNTTIVVGIVAHFYVHGGMLANIPGAKRVLWNILVGNKREYSALVVYGAMIIATSIVMFWNYFANRRWTFRH